MLDYNDDVKARTEHLYPKVKTVISPLEWQLKAPLIDAILTLKKERDAVILAHNYMTPDIFHGVADYVGDSLGLARQAALSNASMIIQGGVHFMAETSKILAPEKTVLIPDLMAGCSLASSITADDVRRIKGQYPGLPVVTYVNTSADVKAETDICCTSSNAVTVVEWAAREWGVERVIVIPDEFLAANIARQTHIGIITWKGACEVHEQFTKQDLLDARASYPGAIILAHPECPPEVIEESDFTGSTAAMIDYVAINKPQKVIMVTECSMADNVAEQSPQTEFLKPCNLCPHMKRITLEGIHRSLETKTFEITVPEAIIKKAVLAVQRMIDLPPSKVPARYDMVKAKTPVNLEYIS
jgi:quinolinate synthase